MLLKWSLTGVCLFRHVLDAVESENGHKISSAERMIDWPKGEAQSRRLVYSRKYKNSSAIQVR